MKCTIRSCTSSAVLQTQSKNISRLNEVSTRAMKTIDVAREAAALLVKPRDLLSAAEDFAAHFAPMQKSLVKCGFLACAACAHVTAADAANLARECATRHESAFASTKNRRAKFFSTASKNLPSRASIASEIARITRRPIRATRPARHVLRAETRRDSRLGRVNLVDSHRRRDGWTPHLARPARTPRRQR
jgi:hypothetical protein